MKSCSDSQHEMTLICGKVSDGEEEFDQLNELNFIKLDSLGRKISLKRDLVSYFALRKTMKTLRPDIIHSHAFKAGFISRLMFRKVPHIHTFHGHHFNSGEFGKLGNWIILKIEQFLAKITDEIISVGEEVMCDLILLKIGNQKKHRVIYSGVPINSKIPRDECFKKLGLPNRKRSTVLWLGRYVEVKQPYMVKELAIKNPNLDFIMAGEGPLFDGLLNGKVENLHVLPWSDSSYLFGIADVVLMTSKSEGLPMTLIEAQLRGIPVVSTNVGSVQEAVLHGRTGFLADLNIVNLNEGLSFCLELAEKEGIQRIIRDSAKSKFSTEQSCQRHEKLYTEVILARQKLNKQ